MPMGVGVDVDDVGKATGVALTALGDPGGARVGELPAGGDTWACSRP